MSSNIKTFLLLINYSTEFIPTYTITFTMSAKYLFNNSG